MLERKREVDFCQKRFKTRNSLFLQHLKKTNEPINQGLKLVSLMLIQETEKTSLKPKRNFKMRQNVTQQQNKISWPPVTCHLGHFYCLLLTTVFPNIGSFEDPFCVSCPKWSYFSRTPSSCRWRHWSRI